MVTKVFLWQMKGQGLTCGSLALSGDSVARRPCLSPVHADSGTWTGPLLAGPQLPRSSRAAGVFSQQTGTAPDGDGTSRHPEGPLEPGKWP